LLVMVTPMKWGSVIAVNVDMSVESDRRPPS
jgi:hypothetical protein